LTRRQRSSHTGTPGSQKKVYTYCQGVKGAAIQVPLVVRENVYTYCQGVKGAAFTVNTYSTGGKSCGVAILEIHNLRKASKEHFTAHQRNLFTQRRVHLSVQKISMDNA